jgi:type VII secretion-associated protein (TIGR03931 family)
VEPAVTHPPIIEAGPATIRRLDCAATHGDGEMVASALDAVDDKVVLLDERPVTVESLWHTVLQSLLGGRQRSVTVVHPSWWATSRVDVIRAAAGQLADSVTTRRRSWLLAQASPHPPRTTVIVEIAPRMVVVIADSVVAEPRRGQPGRVAEAVAGVMAATAPQATAVVIDAPDTVVGAATLAALIAERVRRGCADLTVVQVDDVRLQRLAAATCWARGEDDAPELAQRAEPNRKPTRAALVLAVAAAAAILTLGIAGRHRAPAPGEVPATFLVEGRVTLSVPAQWAVERVVSGPGSARVQLTSPTDPEVALHVTQSPVPHETLAVTAESLKRAIDAEPPGVFVDFNPSATSAGRPAVAYREVRAGHDIRWTVLLDGPVRISIGCQSRTDNPAAIRDVCERAVRSAHALR